MTRPKILIVGCGAVGLSQRYYLSASAEITYLVRPGRSEAFVAPKRLYDYKSDKLHVLEDYRVIETTSEVAGEEFYCVFDTLDGHTAQSEGGTATIKSVGDLTRDNPRTFVFYDAAGVDIEQHYASTMSISRSRLIYSMELVVQANVLYSAYHPNIRLVIINTKVQITELLEAVYHQNGRVKIQRLPGILSELPSLILVQFMVWNTEDWVLYPRSREAHESWALIIRAQQEVLSLPRWGWIGWGGTPLPYHEFNAFHHGSKVVEQDIELLEGLVAEGERAKMKMPALNEICRRARKKLES
ncbi:hypothetical protein COCCADRAFT_31800 [Bipolaris zeicola 26-R-13]|uniref:Ketopantoate reductase N-terminal domain-containing protein n=1 Tax=Cochliobolus carbonum (strain 26-R-13) TaxID=930089 RepID=W6YP38_COCC2|nr:uncharacterized protein COCCADRAFT_31800 [Bipolaris zeicola 26-R-13]EUC39435.1 hypothetical protein COCCADRAFT_31800 [Bipolaris zeicola 26-R-13]